MNNKILIFQYVIIAMSFFALSHFNFEYYVTGEASDFSIYVLIVLFLTSYLFIRNSQASLNNDIFRKIIVSFTLLLFLTQIPDILLASTNTAIRNILHTLAIPMGYILGQSLYYMLYNKKKESTNLWTFLLILPIFYISYRYLSVFFVDPDSLFFVILLFPLVFCFKKDTYRIITFVLVGIICAFSAKRSILVAYSISLMLFLLQYSFFNRNRKSSFKSVGIFVGLLVALYWFVTNNSEVINKILFRFQGIKDDGGSGRTDLYDILLSSFENSSLWNQMFGHGYRSAISVLNGVPAHNDFLEILYDFGIVPLVIYVIILLKFVCFCLNGLKQQSLSSGTLMLAASVFNIVVLGSLNNIFIDTLFIFSCFLCLGVSSSMVKYN